MPTTLKNQLLQQVRYRIFILQTDNVIFYLEKFIQKTERSLLENPYKLDKQLAALDQELADFLNPAKRQRLEVISLKTISISNKVNFQEPKSDAESDVDKDFEPSYDPIPSPVKTDFDSETDSDTEPDTEPETESDSDSE